MSSKEKWAQFHNSEIRRSSLAKLHAGETLYYLCNQSVDGWTATYDKPMKISVDVYGQIYVIDNAPDTDVYRQIAKFTVLDIHQVIYGQLSEKHRWKVSLLAVGQPGTKSASDPDLTYYQYLFDA